MHPNNADFTFKKESPTHENKCQHEKHANATKIEELLSIQLRVSIGGRTS